MEEELESVKEKVLQTLVDTSYDFDRPHEKSAGVKLTLQKGHLFFAMLDVQRYISISVCDKPT